MGLRGYIDESNSIRRG